MLLHAPSRMARLQRHSSGCKSPKAGGPPLFLVPLGVKTWFFYIGITRAVELGWWDAHRAEGPAGPVEVVFTPAQRW